MSTQGSAVRSPVLVLVPLAWGEEALDAVLAAAQSVAASGGTFEVVLLGAQADPQACRRAAEAGAARIWQALNPALAGRDDAAALAAAAGTALVQPLAAAGALTLVLLPPGAAGEELAARLADSQDGQALGRCAELRWQDNALLAERAAWGGRMRLGLRVENGVAFACLRCGRAQLAGTGAAPITELLLYDALPVPLALERRPTGQRLPPLDGARLVVSGGRGVNEQGFLLLEELAVALGGTLGGSLPAVDAGLVPVMRQVGVSGKFVSPDIYLAVGISGTPQHLAGVSPDTRIVAINQDPEADIFKVAAVGAVGDWQTLLPALLASVRESAVS
ncbi:electron transfer flavoprotein subunit alpha/FixB family protein [Pseudomonas cavernae]|uniref:Electron transfer flavoprotein subunit alpha/FixB family protein n=1 Tax=Pseudomonas cavernae TaxID=2320867 RepID=A0A385Z695_9PSED|nr:FAD-binding protein [Pseudomonas cavernae]AYC33022.1 electron transfer flavoprotein subunit alpha/FixB family protein [Pseudomonas cavernae]